MLKLSLAFNFGKKISETETGLGSEISNNNFRGAPDEDSLALTLNILQN
jgi:hypothetical protein